MQRYSRTILTFMHIQTHISNSPRALTVLFGTIHAADQLCLAALPLLGGLALGLDAGGISLLVAAQGSAWLLASLPAGVIADHWPRARLLRLAPLAAALALALAWAFAGHALPLAAASFLAGCAVVFSVLASFALLPSLVPRAGLAQANARLELARAIATLAAAPLAGWLAGRGLAAEALLLASLAALLASAAAHRLPPVAEPAPAPRPPLRLALREGASAVLGQPVLRAIAACAVLWNLAFFALAALTVPFALGPLGLSPRLLGLSLAGYGLGLLLGALLAPWLSRRVPADGLLIAGPALSLAGAALLWPLAAGGWAAAEAALLLGLAQFSLGFGPMIWQVVQTSLRQAIAPPALLGRVGAVMQVAVFGVRPLGAMAAGAIMAQAGPAAGIWLPLGGFALSLAVLLALLPRRAVREALG